MDEARQALTEAVLILPPQSLFFYIFQGFSKDSLLHPWEGLYHPPLGGQATAFGAF